MTLYTCVILKENNQLYLKIGSADFISSGTIEKLNQVINFIKDNIYEEQIAWHYDKNIPLFEVVCEDGQIEIKTPYLKFLYNMPMWKFKIKSLLKRVSNELSMLSAIQDI